LRREAQIDRSSFSSEASFKGPWRLSFCEALRRALTKARFRRLGLRAMNALVSVQSDEPPYMVARRRRGAAPPRRYFFFGR